MWADVDTKQDFLNYGEVAELALDLIRDKNMLPLSMGIFGTWGTGKSTLLNLIEAGLAKDSEQANGYIIVKFDAWLYQGFDDARAALMEEVARSLLRAAKEGDGKLMTKAKKFLGRVNFFRVAGLAAEGIALALGHPTFGVLSKGAEAVEHIVEGEETKEDLAAVEELKKQGSAVVNPEEQRTPPKEIAAFRMEFAELLNTLNKTLVVFVDNLDRCLNKQTIHTLEALRLFLFLPKTAFIVAADEDMVRHSVMQYYNQPDGRHVTDYLDKLIQVPILVPKLGVQEVRAYLFLLFAKASGIEEGKLEALRLALEENLQQSWHKEPLGKAEVLGLLTKNPSDDLVLALDIADRMAPLLASSSRIRGNPRIVKRMLNVVRLRTRIAKKRGMPIDEAVIAKLALFERCTDSAAIIELYRMMNEAPNGRPEVLKKLEEHAHTPDKFKELCPDSWKRPETLAFIQEWVALEPSLSDIDLRPAVYLSRETLPLRVTRSGLSNSAMSAVRVLLKTMTQSSPSAKTAIAATDAREHSAVMDALLGEFRKHTDWKSKPSGFDGALILADTSHEAGLILARFIRALPSHPKLPPWLNTIVKDESWYTDKDASH